MIRIAKKNDLESVYRLMRQLSRYEFVREQFESCFLYNLENNHVLVYDKDENIIGCGILTIHYPLHFSEKTAEVVELIVDADFQSRGIGKKLLASLEQIAAREGCICMVLSSGNPREDAHRFYKREGFVHTHKKFTKELN